ncbi:MAG: glycosyltransferase family 1 protein [Dongiaceae bacterium]
MTASRLLLDVSTLVRWLGPPTGMIRVEQELAYAALGRRGVVPVFFDPAAGAYRGLRPKWAELLVGPTTALDAGVPPRRGWRRLVPPRHRAVRWLERHRHGGGSGAALADRLQRLLFAIPPRYPPMLDREGHRLSMLPADMALGPPLALGPADAMLSPSSDWPYKDTARLAALKRSSGFRLTVVCYDLIPITHPQFFKPEDGALFTRYWTAMFGIADRVVVNAARIRADVLGFCAGRGLPAPEVSVVPLGFRLQPPAAALPPLPAGLQPGRFALFVSTIEPRKNHALLLAVWRRLLARGIPQRHDFRLVFVGRPGWMVDALLAELRPPVCDGTVLHLTGIDDATLDALYQGAGFCLYPSVYEGFGLPVIEAYARGRAVIASRGGSLEEVVGGLGPALDPGDEAAWEAAIAAWIESPEALSAAEARIRQGFRYSGWDEVAERLFALARAA